MTRELVKIGYWSEGEGGTRPEDWVDTGWDDGERRRVSAYLKQGNPVRTYPGSARCRWRGCGFPDSMMGFSDLSDGQFMWPEGFAHYLDFHQVKPPESFLSEIRSKLPAWVEDDRVEREALRKRFPDRRSK
jgi:hypothetical protein